MKRRRVEAARGYRLAARASLLTTCKNNKYHDVT